MTQENTRSMDDYLLNSPLCVRPSFLAPFAMLHVFFLPPLLCDLAVMDLWCNWFDLVESASCWAWSFSSSCSLINFPLTPLLLFSTSSFCDHTEILCWNCRMRQFDDEDSVESLRIAKEFAQIFFGFNYGMAVIDLCCSRILLSFCFESFCVVMKLITIWCGFFVDWKRWWWWMWILMVNFWESMWICWICEGFDS
jgi:hypothetical protein